MKRHNAADPAQVRKREREAAERRERDQRELKALLALPEFRRYMLRQMCVGGGLFQSAFNGSGSVVYFNIGRQDFAREMWGEIERVDPAAIPLMLTEQLRERTETDVDPPAEPAE